MPASTMQHLSIRTMLSGLFHLPLRPTPAAAAAASHSSARPFSLSPAILAKKKGRPTVDRRITLIRHHLYHPTKLTPRPLRFSRNRALRHWTIRRAWSVFSSKRRQEHQLELERQYNAMRAACEELRTGLGDGGRLFRRAMMKTGVWSIPERGEGHGVPIEYSRGLSQWVGGKAVGGAASGDAEAAARQAQQCPKRR
ncbi:hypothetical protein DV737_g487, partial [Chaetothyriales sp. CBS 132003]